MKKNHIVAWTIATTFATLVSCSDDALSTTYSGSAGLGFASSVLNVEVSSADANQILVPIYRGSEDVQVAELKFEYDISASDASEPNWTDADPSGLFSLTTQRVIFADGANVAYAQVRFRSLDLLGITTKYKMRLTIKDSLSPSQRNRVTMTVNRQLTFDYLGQCDYFDSCLFESAYKADIYRARESEIYRVMDPYTEGLVKEEYAENGWMGTPANYVQFIVDANGKITYEPFCTGMLVNAKYAAYAYYPSQYIWGKDFSDYDKENKKLSDKVLQLYPVYCLPDYQYGFLNDGVYPLIITLP
jgi:hypothetical protein